MPELSLALAIYSPRVGNIAITGQNIHPEDSDLIGAFLWRPFSINVLDPYLSKIILGSPTNYTFNTEGC